MNLALFDLDHTLLDGDSNSLWISFLVEHGHLPPETLPQQAAFMRAYQMQTLDIHGYLGYHLRLLASRTVSEWLPVRRQFLTEQILPRIPDAARDAVRHHLGQGDRVAIVTATHSFLSQELGDFFGVPVLAPQAEVMDDRLTGRIAGPVCFRERKLECLALWLERENLDAESFASRYFYSDSANDLPLLEAVDRPVAVNPDAELGAIAVQRGWPVLHWHVDATVSADAPD